MPKPSIPDLLARLPDTDREIRARTPLPTDPAEAEKEKKRRAAEDRWGNASKFTGPAPLLADNIALQIFEGGRKSIVDLLGLIRDPSDVYYKDYKPEYLLRCLSLYATRAGKDKDQKLLVRTLASEMEEKNTPKYLQFVLIRELGWIGNVDAIKALGRSLSDESLCDEAASALVSIGGPAAAEQFRKAFAQSAGKCRLAIAQHLGTFRDSASMAALQDMLIAPDDELRLVAAWSLARIGNARSINPLLKFATETTGYARTKATQACLLLAENLSAMGQPSEAMKIYSYLKQIRTAPEDRYLQELLAKRISAPV
jgi:HEAT repeat protein